MERLERYLDDCEGKRRRMRDRPSDAVLAELRELLEEVGDRARPEGEDPGVPGSSMSGQPN